MPITIDADSDRHSYGDDLEEILGNLSLILTNCFERISSERIFYQTNVLEIKKERDILKDEARSLASMLDQTKRTIQEQERKSQSLRHQIQSKESGGLTLQLEKTKIKVQELAKQRDDLERHIEETKRLVLEREKTTLTNKEIVRLRRDVSLQITQMDIIGEPDDHMKFVFKYIQEEHPERTFWFRLHIDAKGVYHGKQCHPDLPIFHTLVKQLNYNRKLFLSIKRIRQVFVAYANPSSQ